jgi:hypothetical protein
MLKVREFPKTVNIGYNEVKIYPEYCVMKPQNCVQCYIEGKIRCRYARKEGRKRPCLKTKT